MAALGNLLKLGQHPEKAVLRILTGMHRRETPFRAEVEGSNYRFNSLLRVVRGVVVVAKPARLVADVKKGSWIRFRVPGGGDQDIRMEVVTPTFVQHSGKLAILCKIPSGFAPKAERQAKRFNTIRYKNLHLVTSAHHSTFRIVDISATGCKIVLPEHWLGLRPERGPAEQAAEGPGEQLPGAGETEAEGFLIGEPLPSGVVRVGERIQVQLENLVPRVHIIAHGRLLVGLEWAVERSGDSPKLLHHLINELQKEEDARIKHQLF